jgi:hypothetical protein
MDEKQLMASIFPQVRANASLTPFFNERKLAAD